MQEMKSQQEEQEGEIAFDPPIKKDKTDKTRCIIITVLCLVNLTANSAYSSIAPFFPAEA